MEDSTADTQEDKSSPDWPLNKFFQQVVFLKVHFIISCLKKINE